MESRKMLKCTTSALFSASQLEWATMPCRYLQGLIPHLKAFPLFQEAFLGKSHTVQSSSWLHGKSEADQCMDTSFIANGTTNRFIGHVCYVYRL